MGMWIPLGCCLFNALGLRLFLCTLFSSKAGNHWDRINVHDLHMPLE